MSFWGFKQFRFFVFAGVWLLCSPVAFSYAQTAVCFGASCFYPEVAQTMSQKEKGLMGRDQLAEDGGMLFVYDQEIRPAFWMKNMRMALDFIWISEKGQVVDIHQEVPPCGQDCPSIVSRYPLKYVLEISAGTVEKIGIEIGDHALIKLGETK